MNALRTLGHGTLAEGEFLALVHGADLEAIVDIRRFPGSRRNPQFSAEMMARWLPEHGVEYRRLSSLGGRRKPTPDSPNTGLRNEQFRAYADHMTSAEFVDGITELCALARTRRLAVMCAESVWWRCHRRLLADHLVFIEQTRVEHLFHDGRLVEHVPMPEARRVDDHLVYVSTSGQPASFDAGEQRVKVDQAAVRRSAVRDATNLVVVETRGDAESALKVVPGPDVVARKHVHPA